MANRVFQNVVYQMKDAVDRVVGVVDETGTVISVSYTHLQWGSAHAKRRGRRDLLSDFCRQ